MAEYSTHTNQFLKSIDLQPYERYLPNAFNDSLTMLEKVNKVIYSLNETNQLSTEMVQKWNEFAESFNQETIDKNIESKVSDFFKDDTLIQLIDTELMSDFKKEITQTTENNVNGLVDELKKEITQTTSEQINNVNEQLTEMSTKEEVNAILHNVSNGTPLFSSSVDGMTDRTRLYVNTTDGLLYVHNGSAFVSTGRQYQSTGILDDSITKSHLSKIGGIVQNYTLTTIPESNAFTGAFTMVLDKISSSIGYIRLKIRSQTDQQNVTIYALSKSAGTFTVLRKTTVNLKAGVNEINTNLKVDSGQYFAISFPASTAYYDNSSQLTQWYLPGTTTYNVGGSFVPNYQQHGVTATFSFDYSVISSFPAVTTETIQNEAITNEKIAPGTITKDKLADGLLNNSKSIKQIMSKLVLSSTRLKIKLIGDSITQGVGGTGFAQTGETIVSDGTTTWKRNPNGQCWANSLKSLFERKFNCIVTNNACTGTSSSFIVQHISTLINNDDNIVICMIGTNNRNHAQWLGQSFYNDLQTIHKYCSDRGIDIIFMANIPASIEDEKTRVGRMEDINHVISKYTSDKNMEYIDLFSEFYNYIRYKNISLSSLLADGLHPNDVGYDVMYRIICEKLGLVSSIDGATW